MDKEETASQSSNISEASRGLKPQLISPLTLHPIELLKDKDNLTSYEIENLKNVGYQSIESILLTPSIFLKRILTNLNDKKNNYIWTKGIEIVPLAVDRDQFINHSINNEFISTGSSRIDAILKGGIEIGKITEIFGEARAGKTQFCHTLAINCQIPRLENQSFGGRCIYIDTEKTFTTSRLISIGGGMDSLDNIDYFKATSTSLLFKYLKEADYLMTHSKEKYSLLIIDSIMSTFRAEYDNDQIYLRQKELDEFVILMRNMCKKHNIAIVYTNQVAFDFLNGANCNVPVGGFVLSKASHTRLQLIYNEYNLQRNCQIMASPYLKENVAKFAVKPIGISDVINK